MLRLRFAYVLVFALAHMAFAQCYLCPTPVGSPPTHPVAYGWVWDETECDWVLSCDPYDGCESPIVIDTDGSGFHLTSAADGVMFDFYGTGTPIQIAWTKAGSTNGWLALPVDGQITSARNLFGNITLQLLNNSRPANGFAALSIYDLPSHGGHHDGVIDSADAVWTKLRVWIDTNHDGVAQPQELHTLEEIGIRAIPLQYTPSQRRDGNGNTFRFRGSLIPVSHDSVDRKIFDVFLATK